MFVIHKFFCEISVCLNEQRARLLDKLKKSYCEQIKHCSFEFKSRTASEMQSLNELILSSLPTIIKIERRYIVNLFLKCKRQV